tara:strand:- start:271 stop:441 length:171 start_codon:yes stop_codon:yes gene_type:complete
MMLPRIIVSSIFSKRSLDDKLSPKPKCKKDNNKNIKKITLGKEIQEKKIKLILGYR